MKNFDSRTYSIHDFIEWDKQKALILNPAFQRKAVWTDKAKSYLMDTILRGKPIPKIFIRQKLNVTTKESIREVVDGQQRLRSIISYIKDGFVVSKSQNEEFGGKYFSQLSEEIQGQVLSYEISVDLLINLPDSEILDIFSRLNSYAIVLNEQERINANHFSSFKILADELGRKYYEYWTNQGILSSKEILRMQEVSLVADILIAMLEGIKSKKQIKKYYSQYESKFDHNVNRLENNFDQVISTIARIYPEGLSSTEFSRVHLFYSLFSTIAHCLFKLPDLSSEQISLEKDSSIETARNGLDRVGEIFEEKNLSSLNDDEKQFMEDCRRATTDEKIRERRTKFLLGLMKK